MAGTIVTVTQAEIENTMKNLCDPTVGVLAYAFYSQDAIPIKYDKMDYMTVVQYGALISDLVYRTTVNLRSLDLNHDNDLQTIRIRTAKSTELIISIVKDYFMLVVQKCASQTEEEEEQEAQA